MWGDVALAVLSALALAGGLIGCLVPVVPGPVLSLAGVLLLVPTRWAPSGAALAACGGLTAAVLVLDWIVPALGAKKFNCSKWGVAGCTVGTLAGMFFPPFGIFVGAFAGAFLGEAVTGRSLGAALKGGFGAFVGFLTGLFLKVCACVFMAGVAALSVWGTGVAW